jgi:hypothetical protein
MMGDGKTMPAGFYGSVEFAAICAGNRAMRQSVTFRLSREGAWRVH